VFEPNEELFGKCRHSTLKFKFLQVGSFSITNCHQCKIWTEPKNKSQILHPKEKGPRTP